MMMGGMNMQMVARAQLAWDLTRSEIAVVAVGAGFAPPILVFSLFGGTIADRFERKRIIQLGQFGSVMIALFIAISVVTDTITIGHLFGASIVQGLFFAFLMPARQAIIPQLVAPEHASNAIALNASGMSLMTMLAPAVGGLIYGHIGAAATYFTITGLGFTALILTSFLPKQPVVVRKHVRRVWGDMKEGMRYATQNRTLLMLLLLALSTTVLAMPFRSLMPAYVDELFNLEAPAVGLMLSMIGAGSLVGTLLIAGLKTTQHRGGVLLLTTAVSGLALALAGIAPSYAIAVTVMVLLGLGDAGRRSLNASLIMELSDEEHRGRVMGVYMMNFGLIPLGAVPLGVVAELAGVRYAVVGVGVLLVVMAVLATLGTRRIRAL